MNTTAESTIKNHSLMAAGGGLIPIPLIDFIAVSGIQAELVKKLCGIYQVDFYKNQGKSTISALVGTSFASLGSSLIKAIPGLGSVLGGVSMSILSGATTYAIGQVFAQHFEDGGTMADLDTDDFKRFYNQKLEEGKQLVKDWKDKEDTPKNNKTPNPRQEKLQAKLAEVKQLFENGIIDNTEYESMRKKLFEDYLE